MVLIRLRYLILISVMISLCVLCNIAKCNQVENLQGDKTENVKRACGPVALQQVLSLLGEQVNLSKCEELIKTDYNGNASLLDLQKASHELGYETIGLTVTSSELRFLGCPAILQVMRPRTDGKIRYHYVVYTGKKDEIEIVDPARNITKEYMDDQIEVQWTGKSLVYCENRILVAAKLGMYKNAKLILALVAVVLSNIIGVYVFSMCKHKCEESVGLYLVEKRSVVLMVGIGCISISLLLFAYVWMLGIKENNKPKIVIESSTIEFGNVELGSNPVGLFWVANKGNEVLKINRNKIKSSCSCLKGMISKSELIGGERAVLKIQIGRRKELGPFEYKLSIPSNNYYGNSVIKVVGDVVGAGCVIYPSQLHYGYIKQNEKAMKTIQIIKRKKDIRILSVICDNPAVKVSKKEENEGEVLMDVIINQVMEPGRFEAKLFMTTNDQYQPEIIVPIECIVEAM